MSRIDTEIKDFSGICEECGYVIDPHSERSAPDWYGELSSPSSDQDWSSSFKIRNAAELRIARAFELLEEIADALNIPSSDRVEVAELFCDAHVARLTDGRDTAGMVSACIRAVSVHSAMPVPFKVIVRLSNVEQAKLRNCLSVIHQELDYNSNVLEPVDYLPYLATQLSLSERELHSARNIIDSATEKHAFVGMDPAAITAAGVYLTSDSRTQTEIADAVGVSTETLRKRTLQLQNV